ncbi:carbohydrate kinase [Salimicrobium jeotgali]|uniref:Carbohydrate kinase n=1 Tax=Salimicrobium jeotgali TaxID=1230341 RepID=K2GMD9_9BACI|nr:carbohydrate kinase family protein [Salimicrobium jeotgali]APC65592.1 carbohydrate kinase [Salimicrobium jeotgali]EKE31569.1 hypothetical protein MJ3_07308 [Salimicrobium jeotgali]MBM7696389.1 sugar/nucleoside kinase (ribokinase family) [Salimicrobium jeotgali]
MSQSARPIVCVGGANVDKKLYAKNEIVPGTSNPVSSSTSVGGVARNIAENLGRIGEEVVLLTTKGNDAEWLAIDKECSHYVNLDHVFEIPDASTGSYTAVLESDGNLSCAYADMDVFDELTKEKITGELPVLEKAACIIADLNCPAETVKFLQSFALENDIPFVIIPVSSPKMDRLPSDLTGVEWLIVNQDETETTLGMKIDTDKDWKESVYRWMDKGAAHVIVTGGERGVMAGDEKGVYFFPSLETRVTDVTGAGDSFCAAVIYSWLQKESFQKSLQAGLVNARKTIMSNTTVRQDLSEEQLKQDREEFFNGTVS